jgi:hypothetical protein
VGKTSSVLTHVLGTADVVCIMIDASAVAGYLLVVASGSRRGFVVQPCSCYMQGLVVARDFEACSQDACFGLAVACQRELVVDVVEQVLQVNRRCFGHQHRSRRYQRVLGHSGMPVKC